MCLTTLPNRIDLADGKFYIISREETRQAKECYEVNFSISIQYYWWVPPLHLVCHNIVHTAQCNAKGTLFIPVPFITYPDGCHLAQSLRYGTALVSIDVIVLLVRYLQMIYYSCIHTIVS